MCSGALLPSPPPPAPVPPPPPPPHTRAVFLAVNPGCTNTGVTLETCSRRLRSHPGDLQQEAQITPWRHAAGGSDHTLETCRRRLRSHPGDLQQEAQITPWRPAAGGSDHTLETCSRRLRSHPGDLQQEAQITPSSGSSHHTGLQAHGGSPAAPMVKRHEINTWKCHTQSRVTKLYI